MHRCPFTHLFGHILLGVYRIVVLEYSAEYEWSFELFRPNKNMNTNSVSG